MKIFFPKQLNIKKLAVYAGIFVAASLMEQGELRVSAASAAISDNLALADSQLSGIEATFARIEKTNVAPARDQLAAPFEEQQQKYANAMLDRYSVVVKEAKGAVDGLKAFEDLAQRHEARLSALTVRAKRLQPPGVQSMLAVPSYVARREPSWSIVDVFIAPAHAAIALRLYNACKQPRNNAVCAQAVVTAAQDGVAARNTFNACWDRYAKTKPNWWRATLRAGCTAALVARLA